MWQVVSPHVTCHTLYVNESCRTHLNESYLTHLKESCLTRVNESCLTCARRNIVDADQHVERVMSHTCERIKSHTREWVVSHTREWVVSHTCACSMSHTCERVTSRTGAKGPWLATLYRRRRSAHQGDTPPSHVPHMPYLNMSHDRRPYQKRNCTTKWQVSSGKEPYIYDIHRVLLKVMLICQVFFSI